MSSGFKDDWHSKKQNSKKKERMSNCNKKDRWEIYANEKGYFDYRHDQGTRALKKEMSRQKGSVRAQSRSMMNDITKTQTTNTKSYTKQQDLNLIATELPTKNKIFNKDDLSMSNNMKNDDSTNLDQLPDEIQNKLKLQQSNKAKFAKFNDNWQESKINYQSWSDYHKKYKMHSQNWDIEPVNVAITMIEQFLHENCNTIKRFRIADLGCGQATIVKHFYDDQQLVDFFQKPTIAYKLKTPNNNHVMMTKNENLNDTDGDVVESKQDLEKNDQNCQILIVKLRIDSFDLFSRKQESKYTFNLDFTNIIHEMAKMYPNFDHVKESYDIVVCCLSLQSKVFHKLKQCEQILKKNQLSRLLIWQPKTKIEMVVEYFENANTNLEIVSKCDLGNRFVEFICKFKHKTSTHIDVQQT